MRSAVEPVDASTRPKVADFLATNRGGGLYSEAISQPLGAFIAYMAARLGITPAVVTLTGLVVGLATSVSVIALASAVTTGSAPFWLLGIVALVGWQLAYCLDCADGQLARVTGQTSAAGARLDVLCDVATQTGVVSAVAAVALAYRPATPTWLVAAFAATWMVNLVTSVMQSGPHSASMVTSRSLVVRVVKLIRDYGAVIAAIGMVLLVIPQWTVVVVVGFIVVNGGFLMASIVHSARPR